MNTLNIKETTKNRGAKSYKFLGGNLGNETLLMTSSQRKLIHLRIAMMIEDKEK